MLVNFIKSGGKNMIDNREFYNYVLRMIAIAKIGLKYSKDPYAIENYQEVQERSMDVLEHFVDEKFDRPNYFIKDLYPTPNISVRTLVLNDKNELLLVRESKDNAYSLPGGWCDLGDSPSEAAINEVKQEAGIDIKIKRLLGILDISKDQNGLLEAQYVVCFVAEQTSEFKEHSYETNDVSYFPVDKLPNLSFKNTKKDILRLIDAALNDKTIYD